MLRVSTDVVTGCWRGVQAGVEFGAVRATLTGAIWQMFGTAFALWIPCLPIFFLMRNALNSKAGNKCAPSSKRSRSAEVYTVLVRQPCKT